MIKEFYPYKYSSIPFFGDILNDAKNIGWRKCRKYISWHDLHIYDDDPDILTEAGDSLVDDVSLDPELLGRLYEIWLKASTYNPRTKDFDKSFKVRKQWQAFDQSIKLCKEYHEYSYREVSSIFPEEVLSEMEHPTAKLLCYISKFIDLVHTVRGEFLSNFDIRKFYEGEGHSIVLSNWLSRVYDEVGFAKTDTGCPFTIILLLLNNLGFEGDLEYFFPDEEYSYTPTINQSQANDNFINYVRGGGHFLFRLVGQGRYDVIEIDEQHPFVDKLSDSAESRVMFESFARAYFHAKGKCGNFSDNLFEDFTSYLCLKLKDVHPS